MAVAADPIPTERARELVRGGFDTHIHVDPDVIPRRVDDVTLTGLFAARGLAGFLLKSHYAPTAERAQVVGSVAPEGTRMGAVTLGRMWVKMIRGWRQPMACAAST